MTQQSRRSGKPSPSYTRTWWSKTQPGLVALFTVILITVILNINLIPVQQVSLQLGDIAIDDIIAPRSVTYVSDVLTERAREEAVEGVRDVFNPPDMRVARHQISISRQVFDFIETVRSDMQAGNATQTEYLTSLSELDLGLDLPQRLLSLTDSSWEQVRNETLDVIDQSMRDQIREDRLEEAKAAIPLKIHLDVSEEEAQIISELAQELIVPNSTRNTQMTEERKQEAWDSVDPVQQSFSVNSVIVAQGETVDDVDIEAMKQFGFVESETDWIGYIRALLASLLAIITLSLYSIRFASYVLIDRRRAVLLGLLLVIFTLTAKLLVPGRAILPFLFPAAALAMLVSVLYDPNLAIVTTLIMSAIVGYVGGNSLELAIFSAAGGIVAGLVVRRSPRMSTFFRAGVIVGIVNTVIIFIYRYSNTDVVGLLQLVGASFLNGLFSAGLTLTGFFLVGLVFNMLTSLQLQELARLDHPLLQELLSQAPGTYHHSLMVANLAEQAARRIDADSALVRVGSFYHDIGKLARPYFFAENQNGNNAHSRLDPLTSAQAIASHVQDGLDLAAKYKIPDRIQAFIPEHQGTRLIKGFYHKAIKAVDDDSLVNEDDFRYPGPKPQSKETAIVLLADSCEAASTALQTREETEIEELVEKIVNDVLLEGQLDESGLTIGDLREIKDSFIDTLQGRFHARPKYPGQRESEPLHDDESPPHEKDSSMEEPVEQDDSESPHNASDIIE